LFITFFQVNYLFVNILYPLRFLTLPVVMTVIVVEAVAAMLIDFMTLWIQVLV
jgi:hypothetical protein